MGGSPTPPHLGPHRPRAPAATPSQSRHSAGRMAGGTRESWAEAGKTTTGLGRRQRSTEGIPGFAEAHRD